MRTILRPLIKEARDYSSSDEEDIVAKDPRLKKRITRVVSSAKVCMLNKVESMHVK